MAQDSPLIFWTRCAAAAAMVLGAGGCIDFDAAKGEFCKGNPSCESTGEPEPVIDIGPPGRGLSAAGRKQESARWTHYSISGQSTPVGSGRPTAGADGGFSLQPGILGGP